VTVELEQIEGAETRVLRNASGGTIDRHIGASKVEISAARMPVSANTKNNMKFAIKAVCMGHSAWVARLTNHARIWSTNC
jgi:hypothetical protein